MASAVKPQYERGCSLLISVDGIAQPAIARDVADSITVYATYRNRKIIVRVIGLMPQHDRFTDAALPYGWLTEAFANKANRIVANGWLGFGRFLARFQQVYPDIDAAVRQALVRTEEVSSHAFVNKHAFGNQLRDLVAMCHSSDQVAVLVEKPQLTGIRLFNRKWLGPFNQCNCFVGFGSANESDFYRVHGTDYHKCGRSTPSRPATRCPTRLRPPDHRPARCSRGAGA